MSYYETAILTLFEVVMAIIIIKAICTNDDSTWKDKLIFLLGVSFLVGVAELTIHSEFLLQIANTLIMYFLMTGYLKKVNRFNMASATIIYFVVSVFVLLIQVVTIAILIFVLGGIAFNFITGLCSQTLSILLTLLFVRLVSLKSLERYCSDKHMRFRVSVTVLFLAYYFMSIAWKMDLNNYMESLIGLVIIAILTIGVTTMLVKESVVVSVYEEKIKNYETYLKIIDDIIEEFRSCQHDYHNHIQTLVALNDAHDQQANTYMDELVGQKIWSDLTLLDNKILTALFYSKYKKALEKDIQIEFSIMNGIFTSNYQLFDIVEMYGILIDNAIEASSTGALIQVSLSNYEEKNRLEVINPHAFISSNDIRLFFTKNYTTKKNSNNGIGLHKLKDKILKKDDQIYFSYNSHDSTVVVELVHH